MTLVSIDSTASTTDYYVPLLMMPQPGSACPQPSSGAQGQFFGS